MNQVASRSAPVLEFRNVHKSYGRDGEPSYEVLKGVNLSLGSGEAVAIMGPSGSGKSTLLNLMGALDKPTSGEALFEGKNLAAANEDELAYIRSRGIGFIFQLHHLLPQCTALENVLIPTMSNPEKAQKSNVVGRAERLLQRVGLAARKGARPAELSGGERQRVAVVRALINQPGLLLADEPTGALDHKNAQSLMELLLELNREEKVTLILVTHASELAALLPIQYELREGQLSERNAR